MNNSPVTSTDANGAPCVTLNPTIVQDFLDNGDVWERIFAFLELRHRIRLEAVSQRLESFMLSFWRLESSFDAPAVAERLNDNPQKRIDGVFAILARIGTGLRSLKLNDELFVALSQLTDLASIGQLCHFIESIDFHVKDTIWHGDFAAPFDLRFDSFSNLKSLSFTTPSSDAYVCASATLFLSIPPSIESVSGLRGPLPDEVGLFATAEQLETFFSGRSFLREVRLAFLYTGDGKTADIFAVIAERCLRLKKLSMEKCDVDFHGLAFLESMKKISISGCYGHNSLTDAELIDIRERNPLVEVLSLSGAGLCQHLGVTSFNAISTLTKLRELTIGCHTKDLLTAMEVTDFIRKLGSNSGGNLRSLDLGYAFRFSTATIEALGAGCRKLRNLVFFVRVGDATPTSIRHLVDCIVADPTWNLDGAQLKIDVLVCGVDADASAPFRVLTAPDANLPSSVKLEVSVW